MKASVCIEMGWTEQEFLSQNWTFLKKILDNFKTREKEIKKSNRKIR